MMCARVGVNRGIFSTCVFATVAQVAKMLILPRKNKEKQREVDHRPRARLKKASNITQHNAMSQIPPGRGLAQRPG